MERALREKLAGCQFENVSAAHSGRMRAIREKGNKSTERRLRALLIRAGVRGWKMHPEGFQGTFGSEGMLPALAVMYLIVPVFSFMITSIAQHAGGAMLGSLIGQGQEASMGGTMGAVTQPGSMAGRLADSHGGSRREGRET